MPTILPKIEAGFRLDEVLDVNHGELRPVVKELVVLVVTVRGHRRFGRQPIRLRRDLFEEPTQEHVNARRRQLEFLEPLLDPVDLDLNVMWLTYVDTGGMDMANHPAGCFALRHKNLRV